MSAGIKGIGAFTFGSPVLFVRPAYRRKDGKPLACAGQSTERTLCDRESRRGRARWDGALRFRT